jgi:hypothetical protein
MPGRCGAHQGLNDRIETGIAKAVATAQELASDMPVDRNRIRVADGAATEVKIAISIVPD